MAEEEFPPDTPALIAYRLGRVEKAVELFDSRSIERDEKILEKLESIGEVAQKVSHNSWRIESLENSRTRIYQFISAISVALTMMILQQIFHIVF